MALQNEQVSFGAQTPEEAEAVLHQLAHALDPSKARPQAELRELALRISAANPGQGIQTVEWLKMGLLLVIAVAAAMTAGHFLFRL